MVRPNVVFPLLQIFTVNILTMEWCSFVVTIVCVIASRAGGSEVRENSSLDDIVEQEDFQDMIPQTYAYNDDSDSLSEGLLRKVLLETLFELQQDDRLDAPSKRYDPLSIGGRFGKRGGGRKRDDFDRFGIAGRFGKRSFGESYDLDTRRFGKRDFSEMARKRFDDLALGGRFGKRQSKRLDDFGLGGRFGRDLSRVENAKNQS